MGAVVLALIVGSSLLSVNTFPFVTNDAVVYLEHSRDLSGYGLVVEGFRQAGYPIFLAVVRATADGFGVDPLLSTAVVQRLLLVAAGVLAFVEWRWWSLPLVVFLFAPATIAYANFLITEAVALPLAVLLVFFTARSIRVLHGPGDGRKLLLYGSMATLVALALFALRFTFAVFGVVPLFLALAGWPTFHRRLAVGLFAGFVVLSGVFVVGLTLENREESGVPAPSVGSAWTGYYYAWQHVFVGEPDNRLDSSLAEFYDHGEVHDLERQLTSAELPAAEQAEAFEAETRAMLRAAGVSVTGSRLESMVWSLAGGRLHDVAGGVFGIVHSTADDVEEWIYFSSLARERGPEGFADAINDGRRPEALISDPIGFRWPLPDGQSLAMVLVPLSVLALLPGTTEGATRWLSVMGLVVLFTTTLALGWLRADNFRFLLVPSAFALATATSTMPGLAARRGRRSLAGRSP